MRIAVMGDCALDVIVRPPDAPMPAGGDARARIELGPGGQAANVAVRLARAGVAVRLLSPVGDDPAGDVLRAQLRGEGVELAVLDAPRTSIVVALVAPGGERTMLSDRVPLDGPLHPALAGAEWIHVSGYALRDRQEAERVVDAVRAAGVGRVSVAGGSFQDWTDAGVARDAIEALRPALVVMNRDEAGLLAGEPELVAADAAARLGNEHRLAVVTDGSRDAAAAGLALSAPIVCPAPATQPVDSTGAGDAVAAELLARLVGSPDAAWPPPPEAIRAALDAAVAAGARAAAAMGAQSA